MSDTPAGAAPGDPMDEMTTPDAPRRVIGTPPPAQARIMLGRDSGHADGAAEIRQRELPADPEDMAGAKRAERVVALCFVIAALAGSAFIAAYLIFQVHSVSGVLKSNYALGTALGITMLALAAGVTIWVRRLMPDVELTEDRKPLRSKEDDRAAFAETFEEGAQASQFVKRPLLRRTLMLASAPLVVAPIVLLRDLGPLPGTSLDHTVWRRGLRLLIADANQPIKPAQFSSPGSMITVVPDGYQNDYVALAKAGVIIIKFAPGQLQPPTKLGPNWTVDNIVAYSKICTHVGCPAALYEQTTHHILCPCHQSTFDATRGAAVIFGPATRPLPQLPLTVDAQGYLVAAGDFQEPVGPSFWERG